MPTYDYECLECGFAFEAFQNMSDKPLERCPKCKKKVRRLIGAGAGIIFKGSGFYATDYRKKQQHKPDGKAVNTCPKGKTECDACK